MAYRIHRVILGQIDLWAVLTVSLVVGALGVFNVVGRTVVASATLATLGVLAAATLVSRIQTANLTTVSTDLAALVRTHLVGPRTADDLLATSTSGSDIDLHRAMDIRLVGVTLARTLRTQSHALERRLALGAVVRIAIIEPSGEAVREAARRSAMPDQPEIFANRLRPTIDVIERLGRTRGPGRLEVRLLDFVPAFGLVALDPDDVHGRILVEIYSHSPTGWEPTLPLRADQDHESYAHFRNEFDRIWAAGRPLRSVPESSSGVSE